VYSAKLVPVTSSIWIGTAIACRILWKPLSGGHSMKLNYLAVPALMFPEIHIAISDHPKT
jgi:hypothetical protein